MTDHERSVIHKLDDFLSALSEEDRLIIYEYLDLVLGALLQRSKERVAANR